MGDHVQGRSFLLDISSRAFGAACHCHAATKLETVIMRARSIQVFVIAFAVCTLAIGTGLFAIERDQPHLSNAAMPATAIQESSSEESNSQTSAFVTDRPSRTAGSVTTVLNENFLPKAVAYEWSHSHTSQTPKGNKPFLGEFGPEVVTLTVHELPPHKMVHITFDLYLIRSWDGSTALWGPDIWQLSVFNGPTLVRTTFNNCGDVGSDQQAYPDNYPCPPHSAWTGSREKNALGYQFDFRNFGGDVLPCDSVYHIDAWVPHEEAKIAFQFAAFYNDRCAQCSGTLKDNNLADQSWGIANLQVQVAEALESLSDAELKQCWDNLASQDSVAAVNAMWRLVSAGDAATQYISKALSASDRAHEIDIWQVRRAKRALAIINSHAARHALWTFSEPEGKFDTHDERYSDWDLHP
jgi:hypothetical protein